MSVTEDDASTKLADVLVAFREKMSVDLKADVLLEPAPADALLSSVAAIGKSGAKVTIALVRK